MISTHSVLVRSGPWSSIFGLPANKISEIDQPAGLVPLGYTPYGLVLDIRMGRGGREKQGSKNEPSHARTLGYSK